LAIDRIMSWFTCPATDSPTNTSASFIASVSVRRSVFTAKGVLYSFIASVRPS